MTYLALVGVGIGIGLVLAAALMIAQWGRRQKQRRMFNACETAAYRRRVEFRGRTGMPGALYPEQPGTMVEAVRRATVLMQQFSETMRGETA